jgi:hypothetical protein
MIDLFQFAGLLAFAIVWGYVCHRWWFERRVRKNFMKATQKKVNFDA